MAQWLQAELTIANNNIAAARAMITNLDQAALIAAGIKHQDAVYGIVAASQTLYDAAALLTKNT